MSQLGISGSAHVAPPPVHGGISGTGALGLPPGPPLPGTVHTGAPASLVGRATNITGFGVRKEGRGNIKMEEDTAKKAEKAFVDFKDLVIAKLVADGVPGVAQPAILADYDAIRVNIEFGTYKVNITLPNGQKMFMHLTHLDDRANAGTLDSKLFNAAYHFEGVLASEDLLGATTLSYLMDDDEDYEDVLGDHKGLNGLQEAYKGMQEGCREKLESTSNNDLIDGMFETAGYPEGANPVGKKAITDKYEKILGRHGEVIHAFQQRLNDMEARVQDAIDGTITISQSELKDLQSDNKTLRKKINEMTLSVADEKTLLLSITAEVVSSGLGTPTEQVEASHQLLEVFFDQTLELGAVKIDRATNRSIREFGKSYKDYAALIAVSSVYSTSSDDDNGKRVYSKERRSAYQDYLTAQKIDPRRHLGPVGALLRLEGDEGQMNAHAMDRNLKSLYLPKGLSATESTSCTNFLTQRADFRHEYRIEIGRQRAGVHRGSHQAIYYQQAWIDAQRSVRSPEHVGPVRGARF